MNILIRIRNWVSNLCKRMYKTTNWEPDVPLSIEMLGFIIAEKYKWIKDPIYGLLDHVLPIKHMNWQLQNTGCVKGDCDDFATYTSYILIRMGFKQVFRVNLIDKLHVICVFMNNDSVFDVFSNSSYYNTKSSNVDAAIEAYCNTVVMNDIRYNISQGIHYTKDEVRKLTIDGRAKLITIESMIEIIGIECK